MRLPRTLLLAGLLCVMGFAVLVQPVWGEYRAYELEVVDLYDCQLNKRKTCLSSKVLTAMDVNTYTGTHGGPYHIGVLMMATWMCYGDTSYYRPVCPRPVARKAKFTVGDPVKIVLEKHITQGWVGNVEVAYYQASVRSNVYGVRFPNRRNVFARYFEKDLVNSAAPPSTTPPSSAAPSPAAPSTPAAPAQ